MGFFNIIKRRLYRGRYKKILLEFALKGDNVECPCCGRKFITFLPAGIGKRANARCVHCNSLERQRSIWLFLQRKTNFFSSKLTVLHSAPEKIYYNNFSKLKNIQYYSIDLYPESYDYSSKTVKMDITDLKFSDDFFDVVLCNHVLEHVPDDKKAMAEMFRVLKPGGWAIINVPLTATRRVTTEDPTINDPEKQLELFGQPDHVRAYGLDDYPVRLRNAGFDVEIFEYNKTFSEGEVFKYGLKAGEFICRCKKRHADAQR